MGWSSGNEIFDPVCAIICDKVDNGRIQEDDAIIILTNLIHGLQDSDWDTEGESLDLFNNYPYVVKAFELCDITDEGEMV